MSESVTILITRVAPIITNALKASKDLYDLIDEFSNAPEHIRTLNVEIHELHIILGSLQDVLPHVGETSFHLIPTFENLHLNLNNCYSIMVELSRDLTRYTNGYGEISNDRWLAPQLNVDGVKEFRAFVGAYKTSVKISTSLVNLTIMAERTGREIEEMNIQVDQLFNEGCPGKSHARARGTAASQDTDHEFALRQFMTTMESIFDSPFSTNAENSSMYGDTRHIEKNANNGDEFEVHRSPPRNPLAQPSEPSKRLRKSKYSVKMREAQDHYLVSLEGQPDGISIAHVVKDQVDNCRYHAFVEDADEDDFLPDGDAAAVPKADGGKRVPSTFEDPNAALGTQRNFNDRNPLSTFERAETSLEDLKNKPLPQIPEDPTLELFEDGLPILPQNDNQERPSLDDNCEATQNFQEISGATKSHEPRTENMSKHQGHDLPSHHLDKQATDEGMNGQYYTVPEDGSPVTIPVPPGTSGNQDQSQDSKQKSQTSLLIEYFESGKDRKPGAPRPSVRVKVTPSSKSKSQPPHDHIQITERKKKRKPRIGKRYVPTLIEDFVEEQAIHHDYKHLEIPPPLKYVPYAQDRRGLTSIQSVSGYMGDSDNRSMKPQGSSSNETNNSVEYVEYEEDLLPRRRATPIRPQGSSSNETNDSIGGYDPIEVEILPSRNYPPLRPPKIPRTPEPEYRDLKNRFGDAHSSSQSVLPSLLLSEVGSETNNNKGPEISTFKIPLKSSINNPKLLETVEEAIKRLILPELNALKKEQAKKKEKAAETVGNNLNNEVLKNEETKRAERIVQNALKKMDEEAAAARRQERRQRRAARNAAKDHTLDMAADTAPKRRSKTQIEDNFDKISLAPILEDGKSTKFIIEPPDMTDNMGPKDKEASVREWIKESEISNEEIEPKTKPKVVPKKGTLYGDWANPPWMPE